MMKSKRRWSERTRLMLTLELAVVLPAAALVILSAVHLTEIQRDRGVEAAFQRDFNQVLAISEKHINQKAYDLTVTIGVTSRLHSKPLDERLVSSTMFRERFPFGQKGVPPLAESVVEGVG